MIVYFDDLFSIDENKQVKTKKHLSIDGRDFAPHTIVELGIVKIAGYELTQLQGKLLKTTITGKIIAIHSVGEDFAD